MYLHHLHLPGLTSYLRASAIQSRPVRVLLDFKALPDRAKRKTPLPSPTLLTFQTPPTYTCGRREIGRLSAAQIAYLQTEGKAEFHEALRGGQTTFHGPGQLIAYLVRSLEARPSSPSNHVRLLETAVIDTCSKYGITGFTTENPGVWTSPEKKIASVGVHLRRYITSHGIGLNIATDLSWFDRIVACGLVGKKATSFEEEGVLGKDVVEVANVFASSVAASLPGSVEVKTVTEKEVNDSIRLG
ncbi:hypothetical protein MMC07_006535 [Pseudocyphellaria aurata]|nr:hypothetical protein [Pseudocyphellaria aurata]